MSMTPYYERDGVRLFLGDARDVMDSLEPGSIDMIWTDPPYGHGNLEDDLQAARVRDGVRGARTKTAEPIANDKGDDFWGVLSGFFQAAARVLHPDCCCCCCMAGGGPQPTFARVSLLADEHLAFFQAIVWDKSARGNGMGWRYRRNYEFILVTHRKGGRLRWSDEQQAVPNVVRHCPVIQRDHPNQKPVSMISDFVGWHTHSGDLVLDPFMGSGSTGEACIRLGRKFVGIELEERWCEHAAKRLDRILDEPRLPFVEERPEVQTGLWDE